jgi:hypothetical protein
MSTGGWVVELGTLGPRWNGEALPGPDQVRVGPDDLVVVAVEVLDERGHVAR